MRLSGFLSDRGGETPAVSYRWEAKTDGLCFTPIAAGASVRPPVISALLASPEVGSLLEQLVAEDLAAAQGEAVVMDWEQVHELVRSPAYATSLPLLELPPFFPLVPRLQSHGSLTDPGFAIAIAGWVAADGNPAAIQGLAGSIIRAGGRLGLLPAPVWRLLRALDAFAGRAVEERKPAPTRRHWGTIRRLAVEAGAILDEFLVRSVVVTPEKLDIRFRKARVAGSPVVEISPGFDGAPERWLEAFDKTPSVPDHYNIPTPSGAVHIMLSEPVRSVLREIKRLPGRRAAGARAEAFLLNPLAALGEDAGQTIDPEQFEAARRDAGIAFDRFRPHVLRNALGHPEQVGLEIATPGGDAVERAFVSDDEIRRFVAGLERHLRQGLQLLAWQEFELELDGDAEQHLAILKFVLEERARPPIVVRQEDVFDLSAYSDRVVGIGAAEPFMSAYIVRQPEADAWLGPSLVALLKFRPQGASEDVTLPLTPALLPEAKQAIADAKSAGQESVRLPGSSAALPLDEVESAVAAFEKALEEPPAALADDRPEPPMARSRPTLIIKGNIDAVEHRETREERLAQAGAPMQRPTALRLEVELRPHQVAGIARLQHLYNASPEHCRGVLLADDMGLGKTLQLLAFIAWAHEREPAMAPALVVAPVSLLDNWRAEIERFFERGALDVLTAYGEALASLRVPRASVDVDLQRDGLVRFLKPEWRGSARVVLTTYETLRDLEFSFAREPWSILVCDEAQKIKNPDALVTRAVKKLSVRFRVACTGTPVENSLSDLWCLFDMVQPGLLGALNAFGREYGRTIEAGAEDASEKLEKLRALIDPQVIRRTKVDVAKDLPRKIHDADCRLDMSNEQRALYVGAAQQVSSQRGDAARTRMHHLALLRYLRLVCADPRPYTQEAFVPEEPARYYRKAPKMQWLLRTLHAIREKGEKALIFAEDRDVQRLLQHYIRAELGLSPRIVNGDTSVSAKAHDSRQRIVAEFQGTPGFGVLVLSPLAAGFGLNIQAANHVIHYLRHWNPAKEDQATDRVYRIGQTRDVHVYCPLTVAPDFKTFDQKLDELLDRKRALAGDMLQGTGTVAAEEFDLREIVPAAEEGAFHA